jgi:FlaG/FlaF family flagellin (archaellin)
MKLKIKLRKSLNGNLKAVSPVIATIIIVAIAITMSIAVAYWLLGLGSSFTKYEKIEFTTAYAVPTNGGGYTVTLNLKNTGTAASTIDSTLTLYNGYPDTYYVSSGFSSWSIAVNGGSASAGTKIALQPQVTQQPQPSQCQKL